MLECNKPLGVWVCVCVLLFISGAHSLTLKCQSNIISACTSQEAGCATDGTECSTHNSAVLVCTTPATGYWLGSINNEIAVGSAPQRVVVNVGAPFCSLEVMYMHVH